MEIIQQSSIPVSTTHAEEEKVEETFKPTGAIAFFVLLVILSLITWFGIYFIMLSRV